MHRPLGYRFGVGQTVQVDINENVVRYKPAARVARLGDRAIAAFLDTIIPMPFIFFIMTLEAVHIRAVTDDGSYSIVGGPALLAMTLMFLVWMTYAIVAEYRFDGTLGKHIMGVVARTEDRRPITLLQAIIRNLARTVDAIGLYLVGFIVALPSTRSQRIGDRLAKTIVFELDKPDRVYALLLGIAVFVVGIFSNVLTLHLAAGRN